MTLILLLTLAACSSTNNSQKLLTIINSELKKEHKLEHGELLATYDLVQIKKTNCIYATDFGRLINEENYNKIFLKKFKARYKNLASLENEATAKIAKIRWLALKLNNKYQLFSIAELRFLKHSLHSNDIFNKNSQAISRLLKLDKIIKTIPLMLPIYQAKLTSHYGVRNKHPINGKNSFHCGSDLLGAKGTPVYSSADGYVLMAQKVNGYGNVVEIKHSNKFKTKYAHLKKIYVKQGYKILRGQKIGLQGNTGNSTGEHLHFEIWLNNKHVDPFDFIAHACKC